MPPKKGDPKSAAKKGKSEEPKKGGKDDKKGGKDDKKGGKKEEEPPAKGKGKDDGKKGKGKEKKPVSESEEMSEEEEEEMTSEEEQDDDSEEEVVTNKADKGKGKAALKGASKAMAMKGFKPPTKHSTATDDNEGNKGKSQMKKGIGAVNLKKMSDVNIKGASKAMMGFAAEGQKKNAAAAKAQKTTDAKSHLKGASKALGGLTGKTSPFSFPSKQQQQQQPEKAKPKRNLKSTSRLFLRLSKKKKPPTDGKPLLGNSKLFAGFGGKSAVDKKPGLSGFSMFNKKNDAVKETPPPKKTINLSSLGDKGKMAAEAKGLGGKFKGILGKKKTASARFKDKSWVLGRIAAATNWLTGRFLTTKGQGSLGMRAAGRERKRLSFANRDVRGRQTHYYNDGYEYDDEYGYEDSYHHRPRGFPRHRTEYDQYDPYEDEMDYYEDGEWEDEYGYYDDEGNFYYDDEFHQDEDMDYYSYPYGYYPDESEEYYGDEEMDYYYGEDGMLYAVEPDPYSGFYDPYEPELYGDYFDHNMDYNIGTLDQYNMMMSGYDLVTNLYNGPMLSYADPVVISDPYQQHFYLNAGLDQAETGQVYGHEQFSYPLTEPLPAEQFRVPRPQLLTPISNFPSRPANDSDGSNSTNGNVSPATNSANDTFSSSSTHGLINTSTTDESCSIPTVVTKNRIIQGNGACFTTIPTTSHGYPSRHPVRPLPPLSSLT
ncbi:uncharacterized protein V6R79_012626 [Siganus canaliculatus]